MQQTEGIITTKNWNGSYKYTDMSSRTQDVSCCHCSMLLKSTGHGLMMVWYFTPLSTLFKSYRDDGRVIMKGSMQWSTYSHLFILHLVRNAFKGEQILSFWSRPLFRRDLVFRYFVCQEFYAQVNTVRVMSSLITPFLGRLSSLSG